MAKSLPTPYRGMLLAAVDRARTAVFRARKDPDGIKPLYDEEEDVNHERPFVWLVIGWNMEHPRTELSHVEGQELIDMSRPGYTGRCHVKVKIPQVEDAYDVPAGDTEDLVEWIRCEFHKQLDGGPTAALYKPLPRRGRPPILWTGNATSQQPKRHPTLPNDQWLMYWFGRASVAVFNSRLNDPEEHRKQPIFDEGSPIGYVWLGIGWNPDLYHASPRHCLGVVWGAEGLGPEEPIHTFRIRVMTKVYQAEERCIPAGGLEGIKAGLLRQLAEQS